MAGADPFAIMKALGHADIKTTMGHASLGKSYIRQQAEKPALATQPAMRRITFGKPVSERQAVQAYLADMAMDISR